MKCDNHLVFDLFALLVTNDDFCYCTNSLIFFFSIFYYDESKIVLHQGVSLFIFIAFQFVCMITLKIRKDDGECSLGLF